MKLAMLKHSPHHFAGEQIGTNSISDSPDALGKNVGDFVH
jgi:hypothetical protein